MVSPRRQVYIAWCSNQVVLYIHAYIILLFTVKPGDLAYCVQRTEEVLPIALARPYVEQYVPKQTKV